MTLSDGTTLHLGLVSIVISCAMVMFDVGYIPVSEYEGETADDKARERMRLFLDQYPEV